MYQKNTSFEKGDYEQITVTEDLIDKKIFNNGHRRQKNYTTESEIEQNTAERHQKRAKKMTTNEQSSYQINKS